MIVIMIIIIIVIIIINILTVRVVIIGDECNDARSRRRQGVGDVIHGVIQYI